MKLDINVLPPLFKNKNYFHPSVSQWTVGRQVMTMQRISGSDFFGPVEWSFSEDNGKHWSVPSDIPSLGLNRLDDGRTEGVADVRPFLHHPSKKIIAIGCNTYYTDCRCITRDSLFRRDPQFPVYAILSEDGSWSKRHVLEGKCFEHFDNYRVACTQLIVLPDSDILIPIYLQENNTDERYSVCSIRCSFDGNSLKIKSYGNILTHTVKRGFIEPSLSFFEGTFYMTIRAEDDCGYYAESKDGVNWDDAKPWRWDSGKKLQTSTTQQHWLNIQNSLYLVYTRKTSDNSDVMRWRAPLFISRFDQKNCTLVRKSEQTVFPLKYRNKQPNLLGNFHICALTNGENVVSVGSWWQSEPLYTEVWQAKIKKPTEL